MEVLLNILLFLDILLKKKKGKTSNFSNVYVFMPDDMQGRTRHNQD